MFFEIDYNYINYRGHKIKKENLIEYYLSQIFDNKHNIYREKMYLHRFLYLPKYPKDPRAKKYYKKKFLKKFSKIKNKSIKKIETVFLTQLSPFGNSIITLNNIIFYCEIIGCHQILLDNKNPHLNWPIKKPIYIEKLNITIMTESYIDCNNDYSLCQEYNQWNLFYPSILLPEIRIHYIKNEILRYIPEVDIKQDDLYIHIRGGDIFESYISEYYAQPPLCFYEKIIDNNTQFKNIYLLSMDRKNPVLNALINKYKNIIFEQHDNEFDISLLVHAFNIVASVSTFVISSIKFNDNINNLWEYDIFRLSQKFVCFHHHFYKYGIKYNIYSMRPSEVYVNKMFVWKNSKSQLKLMIEDTCPYDFVLINHI